MIMEISVQAKRVQLNVLSQRLCRVSEVTHQRQVAVAHNATQLTREISVEHAGEFHHVLHNLCKLDTNLSTLLVLSSSEDEFFGTEEWILWLESMVSEIEGPNDIPMSISFGDLLVS